MGKYRQLLESPIALATFCSRFGSPEDVFFCLRLPTDALKGGLDYTCLPLVAIVEGGEIFPEPPCKGMPKFLVPSPYPDFHKYLPYHQWSL
ncbi:hypothetical protein ACSBR1_004545 [Camellia fascicularis]